MIPNRSNGGQREIVVIGASAGGLQALSVVLSTLPADLPASVLVVQHLDPRYQSHMADIIGKRSKIKVVEAQDGDVINKSTVFFAPPGQHMLVEDGHVRLTTTERIHFVRPSVDLLFQSVASSYNRKAIAVILTGTGFDGASGLKAIKESGGLTIVQDPVGAQSSGMPHAAIATGAVDMVLPLEDIGKAIVRAVSMED